MFEGFEINPLRAANPGVPVRPLRTTPQPKPRKGRKGKHKKTHHHGPGPSYTEQLLALAIQELGASNRSMAETLGELAKGKALPSPPIEVESYVIGDDRRETR